MAPPISLAEVLAVPGARLLGRLDAQTSFRWIERDAREVQPGDLFIAVRGERFDGHAFIGDAAARGAAAALVSDAWAAESPALDLPLIAVPAPVAGLQAVAAARRAAIAPLVVGITGSLGKSSTKEVVAAVLEARFRTYRSPGNMNSEIGLPLSLLEMEPGTEVAVLEMGGAYAFGELALLARIARPTISVVTNIHPIHLERMGTIEAIAETKAELVDAVPADGVAVLNGDDDRVRQMAPRSAGRVLLVGRGEHNDVRATEVDVRGVDGSVFTAHLPGGESGSLRVGLAGEHAVDLALVAIAVGHALGVPLADIRDRLASPGDPIRLRLIPGPAGSRIIDDTYNASAPSVLSALGLLARLPANRRIAVLGDMRELGDESERQHRSVGRRVAEVVDELITFGPMAMTIADEATTARRPIDGSGLGVTSFGLYQRSEVVALLREQLREGDVVLVKGSRGLEMETIVAALTALEPPR